ncbi:MAG: flagellar biosynthesis protein FlhB [Planctomycetota bacterium]|nr:flagellar biosynthesis protein FlhB [Planctomycetota bacterium]
MAEDMGERTELPTERRLSDARSKGQVARSADVSAAVVLCAGTLLILTLGEALFKASADALRRMLGEETLGAVTAGNLIPELELSFYGSMIYAAPIMLALMLVAFVGGVAQVGWEISLEPLRPKWNKLNFITGLSSLVGKRALTRCGLDILKFLAIGSVVVWVIADEYPRVLALANLGVLEGLLESVEMVRRLVVWMLAVLIVLAVLDFMYQKWQHTQDLRMTRQDVRDEHKSHEGDTNIKARRLKLARQMALQRIGIDVPKADVVVTNPTHYAVALRYDPQSMGGAPRVIAKGADFLALKMRYIAAASNVPIVERPPLARAIYSSVPVGKEIFPEHYEAVAEVLAYVYRIRGERPAAA